MQTTTIAQPDTLDPATEPQKGITALLIAAGIGGAVAVALGTYARVHTPTGQGITSFGLPTLAAKPSIASMMGLI